MSKFNQVTNIQNELITNHEGAPAYSMSVKDTLVTQVLTTFFNEKKFYGDNSQELLDNLQIMLSQDPKFVANLAIYARTVFNLRSISHVLLAELAHYLQGKEYARRAIYQAVVRVDDMTEILAYYLTTYGKPIPNSMKKGLADALTKFNEYQLAKYNRDGAVKLHDLLNLVHPKSIRYGELWGKIINDNLETPVTWETELSARGNSIAVWEDLIEGSHLGYMATLRNLRNILQVEPRNIDKVYALLKDPNQVAKNRVLPFRYYSAYRAISDKGLGTSKIYDALEDAIAASVQNLPHLKGKTFISADVSGSMSSPLSEKSDVTCADISALFLALATHISDESITTTFDSSLHNISISRKNGIIANAKSIPFHGGGTDITLPIQYLLENKIKVDRILIFSDNEINNNWEGSDWYWGNRNRDTSCQKLINQYRQTINPDVWVHAIDLQGYGTQQFKGYRTNILAGWSERTLEFIELVESGITNLSDTIAHFYFK